MEYQEWLACKTQLDILYKEEEQYWATRAKQKWLEEGDGNTKFFHTIATHRRKTNRINSLDINGHSTSNLKDIKHHVVQYYKSILGEPGMKFGYLESQFWSPNDKVTDLENSLLISPFSPEEIKQAVFASDPSGAPGPDGFTFLFYHKFWDLVQSDVVLLCKGFHQQTLDLHKINKSIICLIPKEQDAQTINKFRPISLVNCSFKIISKVLTNRLESLMSRLIDSSQSAFLKGRYILDNVLISQEIIHHSHVQKQPGVIVKVDFEKAYDKIHWSYILGVLHLRGFSPTWIQWIHLWLVSSQSCINVNGELTQYFYCKRGVRQGDPLSPFLFILAADTLSHIFAKGRNHQILKGLGPKCLNGLAITNCHYADDTILFLVNDPTNVESAWWAMLAFEAVSGIKMNLQKTELFAIHTDLGDQLADLFRCKFAHFPLKYLGLPLHKSKLTKPDWDFLITKFESKLQNWKGQMLSIGGRLTLINSVLSSIPLYTLSIFKVPNYVIKQIDSIRCRFLWQGTVRSRKKYALVNWQAACFAKEVGG